MTPPPREFTEAPRWQRLAELEERPDFAKACRHIADRLRDGWPAQSEQKMTATARRQFAKMRAEVERASAEAL